MEKYLTPALIPPRMLSSPPIAVTLIAKLEVVINNIIFRFYN